MGLFFSVVEYMGFSSILARPWNGNGGKELLWVGEKLSFCPTHILFQCGVRRVEWHFGIENGDRRGSGMGMGMTVASHAHDLALGRTCTENGSWVDDTVRFPSCFNFTGEEGGR